ncbi:MAG: phosphoribosylglycinamide formyltransferase [Spirochaetaceae bacterium]|jgi:phosphoribosylglycinamide formyltransferase-1|nr:phosphoribosylglycinamide formyltransferase [Spirochaetaceae bacterium]
MRRRVAVLVSGGGSNLQAIIDAERGGALPHVELAVVVSSSKGAFALRRAEEAGVKTCVLERGYVDGRFDGVGYDEGLCAILRENGIEVVVLAGFLVVLGAGVLDAWKNRIINVHPSLLPSFGGAGCYGLNVHKRALERGVKVSGATVHIVDGALDGGRILEQRAVAVRPGDVPETLQRRVMEEAEWIILPQALEVLCETL